MSALIGSLQLFYEAVRLAEWTKAPYMIENPVSTVSTYCRKPDYTFDPAITAAIALRQETHTQNEHVFGWEIDL